MSGTCWRVLVAHTGAGGGDTVTVVTNELLPSTATVTPVGQRAKKPGRIAAIIGVIAITVTVGAALAATVLSDDSQDSGEPLYVLPTPDGSWQLTNASTLDPSEGSPATSEQFITVGRLYGDASGDGYVDLRSEVFYPDSPLPGAEWESAWEVSDYRRLDDSITLARDHVDEWRVTSSPDDLLRAYDPAWSGGNEATIIAAFTPTDEPAGATTSFDMTSPDGTAFAVETAISASPLFEVATFAERVEPIDIDGVSRWVVTDELGDETETTITWSQATDRTVAVRSAASRDAVIEAARSLQPVTADEWVAAFPEIQLD